MVKYKKGSFTVEAALIMPLVLGVLVCILYIGFYLHDQALIAKEAGMLANKLGFVYLKGSSIERAVIPYITLTESALTEELDWPGINESELYEYAAMRLDSALLAGRFSGISCQPEYNILEQAVTLSVEIECELSLPLPFISARELVLSSQRASAKSVDIVKRIHKRDALSGEAESGGENN